jgi:hypothetical protein
MTEITVSEGNSKYSIETQGGLIEKTSETETTLVLYPQAKSDNITYSIPSETNILIASALRIFVKFGFIFTFIITMPLLTDKW